MDKKRISVIGSGSWGIALAMLLNKNGHDVKIWSYAQDEADLINNEKKCKFLPDITIPDGLKCYTSYEEAMKDAEIILVVTPSNVIRATMNNLKEYTNPNQIFVLCSKGIEADSQKIYTDVIRDVIPDVKVASLSGPSHAEEVSKFIPTVVTISSDDNETMHMLQDVFMNECFRVYTNSDMVGVELGGSLKNIIALSCGIAAGLGFGDNTIAALITRGLMEISRIGVNLGAKSETFYGLSGLGDLVVTCGSMHSRNRRCGILIGQGHSVDDARKEVGMVVEGIYAVDAAYALARKYHVYSPIIDEMYEIIHNGKSAKDATVALMTRDKKNEM